MVAVGVINGLSGNCEPLPRSSGQAAAVWFPDGTLYTDPTDCTSNGASYSMINNANVVIGSSYSGVAYGPMNAIWTEQTGRFSMHDLVLEPDTWTLNYLDHIDDCGRFVASATPDGGTSQYVMLIPVSPCGQADITTQVAPTGGPCDAVPDGLVSAADIQYYVNFWIIADLGIADLTTQGAAPGDPGYGTPDSLVTGADIQFYVNLWVAGCP